MSRSHSNRFVLTHSLTDSSAQGKIAKSMETPPPAPEPTMELKGGEGLEDSEEEDEEDEELEIDEMHETQTTARSSGGRSTMVRIFDVRVNPKVFSV